MGQILSEPVRLKRNSTDFNRDYYVVSSSMQGWRVTMEDSHITLLETPDDEKCTYFGVFDGHGGSSVAYFASRHLHRNIVTHNHYKNGNYKAAIEQGFLSVDKQMRDDPKISRSLSGSTAVIVLIKDKKLYCGNAGDSRAIANIGSKPLQLSVDHKPCVPEEKERIVKAGSTIEGGRINGNLAVSRALGDFNFKDNKHKSPPEQAVTSFPDVNVYPLNKDWKFLVLACDGVWDVMSTEEVSQFVASRMHSQKLPEAIVEELLDTCIAPDGEMAGIGTDNMTVILIIFLNNVPETYRKKLLDAGPKVLNEKQCKHSKRWRSKSWPRHEAMQSEEQNQSIDFI